MSNRSLSKSEALELITPVIDGEVSPEKREAFLGYIERDPEVRRQFTSQKKIKELMATRCPCCRAPETLKNRVRALLEAQEGGHNVTAGLDEECVDRPSHIEGVARRKRRRFLRWPMAAAASLLLILAVGGLFSWYGGSQDNYNLEEYVYRHFDNHGGRLVTPTISAASLSGAELSLSENYNLSVEVPTVQGAELAGVVYSEFVPDYQTPMLEYYQASENQYIYIFVFDINSLDRFKKLYRTESAVKSCKSQKDYHVLEIGGKHVVTWKWEDTWYAAISNHDGDVLASLVVPLQ